ncbi:MAG: hypothetical protein ACOCP8_00785 [archaeon]
MAWTDNYSQLIEKKIPYGENKEWRFVLEEHKTKGTMQINVRLWKMTDNYQGPTKNGFILQIKTPDDIDNIENIFTNQFGKFFTEVREMI